MALIQNIINIGDEEPKDISRAIFYKSINQKRNGFRASIGVSTEMRRFSNSNSGFFFLSAGYEKGLKPFKSFSPYLAFDVYIHAPVNNSVPNSFLSTGFGLGPLLGINYNFNERISLGTESGIFLAAGDRRTSISYYPPVDLVFYVKFPKKVISRRKIEYFY